MKKAKKTKHFKAIKGELRAVVPVFLIAIVSMIAMVILATLTSALAHGSVEPIATPMETITQLKSLITALWIVCGGLFVALIFTHNRSSSFEQRYQEASRESELLLEVMRREEAKSKHAVKCERAARNHARHLNQFVIQSGMMDDFMSQPQNRGLKPWDL